jgi:protein SCO1
MTRRAASLAPARWRRVMPALALAVGLGAAAGPGQAAVEAAAELQERAVRISQAALGNTLPSLEFIDSTGQRRNLDEFRGQPVLVSLIFTACVHSCQVATRHLDRMVRIARNALGDDSFTVLTIGFDQPVDNPSQMASYARRYGITDPNWHFLSSPDWDTVHTLTDSLGFIYQPSPRGYDHTVKVTIVGREGQILRQVYGEVFPTPQLVEPLRDVVFNRPISEAGLLGQLGDRVRLFCTVYDAQGDRYYFDYSLFAGIFIGVITLGGSIGWLLLEVRHKRRRRLA